MLFLHLYDLFKDKSNKEDFVTKYSIEKGKIKVNPWDKLSAGSKLIIFVMNFMIFIYTFNLAWNCNQGSSGFNRLLISLFCAIFWGVYLLYYFVDHVILGASCNS